MKRRTEPIEVEVDGEEIRIIQRDALGNDDAIIVITRDQIPQLVGWLREAEAVVEEHDSPGAE